MANEEHLKILKQGLATWNLWREENPEIQPNLNEAKLNGARLCNADLFKAQLIGVDLSEAELIEADLYGANLSWANLDGANFTGANLISAELVGADLFETNLSKATLMFTDLSYARLVETNFEGTNFSDCFIYGISTWGLKLQGAKQSAFIITRNDESEITVDNLEIAQFIYMLLNNERIRDIVDTITLKVVLILGRFTPERKFVLDALREELRRRDLNLTPLSRQKNDIVTVESCPHRRGAPRRDQISHREESCQGRAQRAAPRSQTLDSSRSDGHWCCAPLAHQAL